MAIITEAMHSSIDLVASIIAWFSVRKADVPADAEHRYGHQKIENVAAATEGVLILVGSGVIVYAAPARSSNRTDLRSLGFGIAVVVFASFANLFVAAGSTARPTRPTRPGSRATPPTCAPTSYTSSASSSASRSALDRRPRLDPVVALRRRDRDRRPRPASASSPAPRACSSTRHSPPRSRTRSARRSSRWGGDRGWVVGYHKLRTRRAGARRYVDMHVQFRAGTTLERAHRWRTSSRTRSRPACATPTC